MKKTTDAVYGMAIAILYSVLKFAWNLYLIYWEEFATLSDTYTKEYGQNMLKRIETVQAMPDSYQRRGNTKTVGNSLDKSVEKGILLWKRLRRYILKAYTGADLEAALQQAGAAHFESAIKLNYGEVSLLLSDGQTFLSGKADALAAAGMPATFAKQYTGAKSRFDEEQASYGVAKGAAIDGTSGKVTANNGLYTDMMMMLGDAQTLFEDSPAVRKQFLLTDIQRRITVPGASGIHFKVCDAATGQPLAKAVITIDGEARPYPVNKSGIANVKLKKSSYQVSIAVPGYDSYQGIATVSGNVMHRFPVLLAKAGSAAKVS